MKKLFIIPAFLGAVALLFAFNYSSAPEVGTLSVGDMVPMLSHKMKDVSGQELNLREIKKDHGLLVVFSCNTCPFVVGNSRGSEGWEGRYNALHDFAAANDIGMVLVNSNEAKRDGDDSFQEMQDHAKSQGYKSMYVVDEDHKLADAFGAKTTPHAFLFDQNLKLVYKGKIDDNVGSAKDVSKEYVKDAIKAMIKGEKVDPGHTDALGCSIKRVKS